jgi:type VI protein secretion system component VasF
MYGFNLELARLRAGEKVAASGQRTLETVGDKTAQAAQAVGGATSRAISSARQGVRTHATGMLLRCPAASLLGGNMAAATAL